jgi:thioredoxin 1
MYKEIKTLEEFKQVIGEDDAALFYFSHQQCNVCKVLKPKIAELIKADFPKIGLFYCDTVNSPELAAQNSVFAVPTLLVYFGGRETIRKSRNLGIEELKMELERPYGLIFE